jgi:hypothetical protein
MKTQKYIEKSRFAACKGGAQLIKILARAAARGTAAVSRFSFSMDCHFRGEFPPVSRSKK